MKKHGFTLIEILVAIAIIATLAAILFPVISKSREQARGSKCLSNMHQLGISMRLYVSDYDGRWPIEQAWSNFSFVKTFDLSCPSIKTQKSFEKSPQGYGYNGVFAFDHPSDDKGLLDTKIQWTSLAIAIAEINSMPNGWQINAMNYFQGTEAYSAGKPFERHNGGANYLFADGHTKWHVPGQINHVADYGQETGKMPTFTPYHM